MAEQVTLQRTLIKACGRCSQVHCWCRQERSVAQQYSTLCRRSASLPGSKASRSGAAPLADNAQAKSQLGTGHGRNESSYAQYTTFERASDTPNETLALYYDSYENLLAQGVPVGTPPIARYRPEPFPERGRFVPDPR